MSAIFIIGKSIETGLPVHVRNAKNGLACNCVCYECEQRLEAIQDQRYWHFRHYDKLNCVGNNETALHQFAKLILCQNSAVDTIKKLIRYSSPVLEAVCDKYRSDVRVLYENSVLHFEVVVHHDLSQERSAYYQANKINCIRINLRNPDLLSASPDEIRNAVLMERGNKDFIQWNEDSNKRVSEPVVLPSKFNHWFTVGVITIVIIFRKTLFGGRRNR